MPFAGKSISKYSISSLWLAFSKNGKLCDFFTPDFDLGSNQFIGEVLVANGWSQMLTPTSAYLDAYLDTRVGETVNSFLITAILDNNPGLAVVLRSEFLDVLEAHATALNWTDTFLSIHVAKTDFSETFRPWGSKRLTEICLCYDNAQEISVLDSMNHYSISYTCSHRTSCTSMARETQ